VKDLGTTAKNLPPELSNPLYRVRGFFPIPAAKTSKKTLDQEVISFIISYRYLRTDGTSPATEQIDFIDNNGETIRGYFSNWEETHTKIREKVYDDAMGIYVWRKENVQDADSININQIDIAISKGEQVEIRVKSLSEAGWPTNPMTSDWSSSVIISFPDNLTADQEVLASLASALSEETRVNFNQDLASRGLDIHLSTSFTQKDKYYAHPSDSISSGFFDTAGNAIDLYNKLKDMDTQIATLKALIEKAKGSLQVYVVDPTGEKYLVSKNSTVDLFAGYYSDIVASLPTNNQKGAIITSLYKLIISNSAVSPLQLASSFPGGLDVGLASSTAVGVDQDYAKRRYDAVPISLSSLDANKTANSRAYQISPFQSAQQLSQYIYNRYTDIGLKTPLYGATASTGLSPIADNSLYGTVAPGSSSFVWKGSFTGTAPDGGGNDAPFCIHILHPDLNTGTAVTLSQLNEPTGAGASSPAVYPKILHAKFFNKEAFDAEGKLQVQYIPTSLSLANTEKYPIKLGFYTNDRYLIGTETCGSYLFMAPASYADLLVDGTDYRAIRTVDFGDENQITIPIVYQFRMTDFYGIGDSGTGRIGGYSVQPKNLVYTKKIGIDIAVKDNSLFSFDLQVSSKYKVDSPSQTAISPAKNSKLSSSQTSSINKIF